MAKKKKIVVDTSIVLAVAMAESTEQKIRDDIGTWEWIAPDSLHYEIGNALGNRLRGRRGEPAEIEAITAILDRYEQIPILFEDPDLRLALEIVKERRMLAYDAYVVALAMTEGVPLATVDHAMKVHAAALGAEVVYFGPVRG